jgi:outer membrane protein TolC
MRDPLLLHQEVAAPKCAARGKRLLLLLVGQECVTAAQRQAIIVTNRRYRDHLHIKAEVVDHVFEDDELLGVLPPEEGEVRLHNVHQLKYDRRYATEMSGAEFPLQLGGEEGDIGRRKEPRGVHLIFGWLKEVGNARIAGEFLVLIRSAWVALQVLWIIELHRIDKGSQHDMVALSLGLEDQSLVTLVQRPHGRYEPNLLAHTFPAAAQLTHFFDASDNFHGPEKAPSRTRIPTLTNPQIARRELKVCGDAKQVWAEGQGSSRVTLYSANYVFASETLRLSTLSLANWNDYGLCPSVPATQSPVAMIINRALLLPLLFAIPGLSPAEDPAPGAAVPEGLPPWITETPKEASGTGSIRDTFDELPAPGDLKLPGGIETRMGTRFLETLPVLDGELFTTATIFRISDPNSKYANLDLRALVGIANENNFDLINTDRSVQISRSQTRSEEAFFLPFVDLVGDARIRRNKDRDTTSLSFPFEGDRTVTTQSTTTNAGIEITQNLPTGGSITASGNESRTSSKSDDNDTQLHSRSFGADADIRFLQPLLRGGGIEVGTASLRSQRLSEMDAILGQRLSERDTALRVINAYFDIVSLKQQLQVSADALRERRRFLEETELKYQVGRVAESEILSAEIQFLQEVESAIGRRQSFENAREDLLLLLGLPLDTQISLVDITPVLRENGRVEIPSVQEAISSGLASRIELMRSDIGVTQSEISLRTSRNNMLPDLNFDAGYGRSDSGDNYKDANELKDTGWDAGLSLRIPVINIQRRESLRQSAIRLEQVKTNRLAQEREITQEIIVAHRRVLSSEASLTVLQKTVEQARKNLQLINGSFEVGFSSVTEVRLAQDDLFQADTRYSSSLLNYQSALANLYRAMGRPLY